MTIRTAELSDLTIELTIDAPPADVWRELTAGIGEWWPDEFYAGGKDGDRRFALEAEPGGRMFESWDDGGGILWATVVGVEPLRRLQVTGTSFSNWGGPSQWLGTWELKDRDGRTQLRFNEQAIGRVSERYIAEKDKGWRFLWETLRARLEKRPLPVWRD